MNADEINKNLKELDKKFSTTKIGNSFLIKYGNHDICTLFKNGELVWSLTFNPGAFIPANEFGMDLMNKLFKGLMEINK